LKNKLEQKLQAASKGALDVDEFMQYLLSAQVFLPMMNDNEQGLHKDLRTEPLLLDTDGNFNIMPVFSSPEAAKDFLKNFKDYSGGLLLDFTRVLDRIDQSLGISINPDSEFGIDLDPTVIQQLVTLNSSLKEQHT